MTGFLTTLAEITLTMSVVIALLLLLGPLLARRYAPRWRYWAWLAVAVRLLIPFNLSLPQAPVQIEAPPDRVVYRYTPPPVQTAAQPPVQAAPLPVPSAAVVPPQATQGAAAPQGAARTVTLSGLLPWLWLAGVGAVLAWYLLGLLRFKRYFNRWSAPYDDPQAVEALKSLHAELGLRRAVEMRLCPGVQGPQLAGLFRPVILLPEQPAQGEALWFALRHELCHCRRRDIAYKTLLLLANAVHWFNPLVWLMRRAAEGDLERACDDDVVKGLPQEAKDRYAQVILDAVRRQQPERRSPR